MGLVTLPIPGGQIQYFSFLEEVQLLTLKVMNFILSFAPGWVIFVTAVSVAFIIIGVFLRIRAEVRDSWGAN